MVELTNIFTLKNIIIYLLIINIIAFLAMFIDKKKAELLTSSPACFKSYSVIEVIPSIATSNVGAEPYSDSWKYPSETYSVSLPSFL